MEKWEGKYIIGLTGNIGTGKSVVRRMLEHLGAYGIDADSISHRAISRDAPCYDSIVQAFGKHILTSDGQIDRRKLGQIVFNDPQALAQLESIIHPMVEQAVDLLIKRSVQHVVVIEAIKLLESNLASVCDSIWVVYSPPDTQISRLIHKRNMSVEEAKQRIAAQVPQETRLAVADVVIKNASSFDDTWKQVTEAWQRHVHSDQSHALPLSQPIRMPLGEVNIERAGIRHTAVIADLINRLSGRSASISLEDVSALFGETAYLVLRIEENPVGLLGWQVENLVSRTNEILLDPVLPPAQYLPIMIREMEKASALLQSEISLLAVPERLALHDGLWSSLGYQRVNPSSLEVLAWQEAAEEMLTEGRVLFFKQLREERVLRPI